MTPKFEQSNEERAKMSPTKQLWQRNWSCPLGTIPVRRPRNRFVINHEEYGRKKAPSFPNEFRKLNLGDDYELLLPNHSYAILQTDGLNFDGAKADIKVCTPNVEGDDEYSASRIALKDDPSGRYESVEAGWMVNPSLYGDRATRIYVYWTVDGSNTTGCFDLACPGFVQTSHEIALGGVIPPVPVPGGFPWNMTLYIAKDVVGNWWVQCQETIYIGYWPAEIFKSLKEKVQSVQWGEVYSTKLAHPGHTGTAMGSGQLPNFDFEYSGAITKMRVHNFSVVLKYPDNAYMYIDDEDCYDAILNTESIADPEFYFGGPGRSADCV